MEKDLSVQTEAMLQRVFCDKLSEPDRDLIQNWLTSRLTIERCGWKKKLQDAMKMIDEERRSSIDANSFIAKLYADMLRLVPSLSRQSNNIAQVEPLEELVNLKSYRLKEVQIMWKTVSRILQSRSGSKADLVSKTSNSIPPVCQHQNHQCPKTSLKFDISEKHKLKSNTGDKLPNNLTPKCFQNVYKSRGTGPDNEEKIQRLPRNPSLDEQRTMTNNFLVSPKLPLCKSYSLTNPNNYNSTAIKGLPRVEKENVDKNHDASESPSGDDLKPFINSDMDSASGNESNSDVSSNLNDTKDLSIPKFTSSQPSNSNVPQETSRIEVEVKGTEDHRDVRSLSRCHSKYLDHKN